jgi:hypothetical protein
LVFHARVFTLNVPMAFGLALIAAGCSTTSIDSIPNWAGGEPQGTPPRLATEMETPPVNERPPARDAKVVSVEEQTKIEKELAAAHATQAKQSEQVKKDRATMIANKPKPNAVPAAAGTTPSN